ncbi:unnamed protein product [Schistocephalus solidus]|uniref:C2H2-type domain-containing protein n=1 Tax=Schistocephalus solidus TaxID=70667 RepID=A0A183SQ29_SCHSO|nr:unnamed protein product [Schistocephalus solidus]
MGMVGNMCIHDSGVHCNADNTDTTCTPSTPVILTATIIPHLSQFLLPTLRPKFQLTHRPGQCHLRIHRTEAGEPVPGAPTYSRHARLHCPHCSRTFTHRMGLLGHMHLHDKLW